MVWLIKNEFEREQGMDWHEDRVEDLYDSLEVNPDDPFDPPFIPEFLATNCPGHSINSLIRALRPSDEGNMFCMLEETNPCFDYAYHNHIDQLASRDKAVNPCKEEFICGDSIPLKEIGDNVPIRRLLPRRPRTPSR